MRLFLKKLVNSLKPTSSARSPHRASLQLETLEDRLVPTGLTFGGTGRVLPNVAVSAVYYGPTWSSSPANQSLSNQMNSFLGQIVNSAYMDQLSEYSLTPSTPGNNLARLNLPIGRGSFLGSDLSSDGWSPYLSGGKTTINDSAIQSMLNNEIANGAVTAPDGTNTLYIVYVQPGVTVTAPGAEPDQVGYHWQGHDQNGDPYAYAVVEDLLAYHITPQGAPTGHPNFQYDTFTTSHELAEAVTDPVGGVGWTDPSFPGKTEEIADIPADTMPAGQVWATLDGYAVTPLWSNKLQTSFAPPNYAVSLEFTTMQGIPYVFALTSQGNLDDNNGHTPSQDGTNWSIQDRQVKSFAVTTLLNTSYVFDLNSSGVLKDSFGAYWRVQDNYVQSFAVTNLNGTNYVLDLDYQGVLKVSNGSGWTYQDYNVTSFAVGSLVQGGNETNYVFDLNSDGVLQEASQMYLLQDRDGNTISMLGWTPVATGVRSFAPVTLAGTGYLFELDSNGLLQQTADGSTWSIAGTNVETFATTTLNGISYVFELQGGILWSNAGSGWFFEDQGVTSLAVTSLEGTNYVWDLTSDGVLKASSGNGWMFEDSGIQSIAVIEFHGINDVLELNGNGVLKYTFGIGWATMDTGVQSFAVANLQGVDYAIDLHFTGQLQDTTGQYLGTPTYNGWWYGIDTGVASFAVTNLEGTNYVWDLTTSGVLKASSGTQWYWEDSGVQSFAVTNLGGTNYVFELKTNGVLYATSGSGWVPQAYNVGAFAVGSLGGVNCVVETDYYGDLYASSGSGWQLEDNSVADFNFANYNGANYLSYVDRDGDYYQLWSL